MGIEPVMDTESYFGKQGHLFENTGESTDLALMVDALAQEESSPWDATLPILPCIHTPLPKDCFPGNG